MTLLPPQIEHRCDVIHGDDGETVEQIYNHLVYSFGDPPIWLARAYLDTPESIAVMQSGLIPDEIMTYLKERFCVIEQLGRDGYRIVWRND